MLTSFLANVVEQMGRASKQFAAALATATGSARRQRGNQRRSVHLGVGTLAVREVRASQNAFTSLAAGTALAPGQSVYSPNGQYPLIQPIYGNRVEDSPGRQALWTDSDASGQTVSQANLACLALNRLTFINEPQAEVRMFRAVALLALFLLLTLFLGLSSAFDAYLNLKYPVIASAELNPLGRWILQGNGNGDHARALFMSLKFGGTLVAVVVLLTLFHVQRTRQWAWIIAWFLSLLQVSIFFCMFV